MIELRTMKMIWWNNPTSTFTPQHYCVTCGRAIKGQPKFAVHVIGGGSDVLHPDDEDKYESDGADLGHHDVGSECAKKFGKFAIKLT